MTAKEKAELLIKTFQHSESPDGYNDVRDVHAAIRCALIEVDEIIDSNPTYPSNVDWDDCGATHQYYYEEQREEALKFWKEVKQEIEKLP